MGLAVRVTASALLVLTIAVWAFSRHYFVEIRIPFLSLRLTPHALSAVQIDVTQELSIKVTPWPQWLREEVKQSFRFRDIVVPQLQTVHFWGGGIHYSSVERGIWMRPWALISCAITLNAASYLVRWRRRRKESAND